MEDEAFELFGHDAIQCFYDAAAVTGEPVRRRALMYVEALGNRWRQEHVRFGWMRGRWPTPHDVIEALIGAYCLDRLGIASNISTEVATYLKLPSDYCAPEEVDDKLQVAIEVRDARNSSDIGADGVVIPDDVQGASVRDAEVETRARRIRGGRSSRLEHDRPAPRYEDAQAEAEPDEGPARRLEGRMLVELESEEPSGMQPEQGSDSGDQSDRWASSEPMAEPSMPILQPPLAGRALGAGADSDNETGPILQPPRRALRASTMANGGAVEDASAAGPRAHRATTAAARTSAVAKYAPYVHVAFRAWTAADYFGWDPRGALAAFTYRELTKHSAAA